jgi:hypothetical protein
VGLLIGGADYDYICQGLFPNRRVRLTDHPCLEPRLTECGLNLGLFNNAFGIKIVLSSLIGWP